jgi:hypothetical protein
VFRVPKQDDIVMSDNSNVSPPVVEVIPSRVDEIAALASAHAPFLYFDRAPTFGYNHGIVNITLEALRFMAVGQTPTRDRVVVAHLRMSVPAAMALKAALEAALLLAAPAAGAPDPSSAVARPN